MTQYTRGQRVKFTVEGTVRQNSFSEDDTFYVDIPSGDYVYIEVPGTLDEYVEILPDPLPTEPGLYGHREGIKTSTPEVLSLDEEGTWRSLTTGRELTTGRDGGARGLAEVWHANGLLVRLGAVK